MDENEKKHRKAWAYQVDTPLGDGGATGEAGYNAVSEAHKDRKYPEKVRFKGVIDGVKTPVFGHHVTREKVDMYVNTEINPPLWIYACDVIEAMPGKFEPVTEYPETIDLVIEGITKRFRLETYGQKQYNLKGYFWDHGGPIPPEIMLNASRQREPVPEPENPAKWTDADMVSFGRSCWSPIKGAKRPKNSCGFRTEVIKECLSRFKGKNHD